MISDKVFKMPKDLEPADASDGRSPIRCNTSPQMPPANEPTARIGMKIPPGAPEPKLVDVNSIFATNSRHSIPKPTRACSAVSIRFEPPPSTSGNQMPTGNAIGPDPRKVDTVG